MRPPLPSTAHRTLTALDGQYPPLPGHASWAANPGANKARFLLDLAVRGTTALADDPTLIVRPYIRHGGASGYVAGGESVTYTRPRLKDLAAAVKAQFTTDVGATYTDNSTEVNDSTTGVMTLNSLDTIANGDWVVIGGPVPFCGIAADLTNLNSNAATMTVEYWNGSAWTAVTGLTDGTSTGGFAFGVDGQITWTGAAAASTPSNWAASTINSISAYWVRIGFSAALDASVTLTEVDLLLPIKAAIDVQADGDDVLLMLESISAGLTGTVAYNGNSRLSWR